MRPVPFRIFLSAVTAEFEGVRSEIARDLRSRGLEVKIQEEFRQEKHTDTTLRKLHDYIRDCSAVVYIGGRSSGSVPPGLATAPFAHLLPAEIRRASYTHWEFFFAGAHRKRLSIYIAKEEF